MEKAKIYEVNNDIPNAKADFTVMFNPEELSIDEHCGKKYEHKNAKSRDKDDVVLSLSLFFNTYQSMWESSYEDVRIYTHQFHKYQNQKVNRNDTYKKICFSWGSICVIGILSKFSLKYTMFTNDGVPVRAEANLEICGCYYGQDNNFKASSQDFENNHTVFNNALKAKESIRKGLLV